MDVHHVSPPDTYNSLTSRGYTQVVSVEGASRMIFVSGQLPLDASGDVVGPGDIERQTRVAFDNLEKSLRAAGAAISNIVKLTTYVTDVVNHPPEIRKVRTAIFGADTPPASTMIEVPRFARPEILIEIDAIAVC